MNRGASPSGSRANTARSSRGMPSAQGTRSPSRNSQGSRGSTGSVRPVRFATVNRISFDTGLKCLIAATHKDGANTKNRHDGQTGDVDGQTEYLNRDTNGQTDHIVGHTDDMDLTDRLHRR